MRNDRKIIYPFTTYSCVLTSENLPESLNKNLQNYLKKVFIEGVPTDKKKSVTDLSQLIVQKQEADHELIGFAQKASYHGLKNKQHECVQQHLLDNDQHTIAIEVPVWDDSTLGHIDILRITNKIGVWDFKPEASKETKAAGQVLRYIKMLQSALNLPLRMFEGGYYDDQNLYFLSL